MEDVKMMLNWTDVCLTAFRPLNIQIDDCIHWMAHYLAKKNYRKTLITVVSIIGAVKSKSFTNFERFLNDHLVTMHSIENSELIHSAATVKTSNDNKASNVNDSKHERKQNNRYK